MSLPKPAHLCTLVLLLAVSSVSIAGTLSSIDLQASGMFPGGPTNCGGQDPSSVSCSFHNSNYDPYGGESVFGSASASSSFGSLSGYAQIFAGNNFFLDNIVGMQGEFSADFDAAVLVTGDTGTGTLVADFSWNAGATANFGMGYNLWPSFTVTVGSSTQSWTSSATNPPSSLCLSPLPCTGSGTLDVSTSFTFGGLTNVGGSTAGSLDTGEGEFFGSSELNSSASLTLTGFSVYDASGNLVPGAVVTPILTTPEPGSTSLMLCGALVLWALVTRRNSQNRSHHAAFRP